LGLTRAPRFTTFSPCRFPIPRRERDMRIVKSLLVGIGGAIAAAILLFASAIIQVARTASGGVGAASVGFSAGALWIVAVGFAAGFYWQFQRGARPASKA